MTVTCPWGFSPRHGLLAQGHGGVPAAPELAVRLVFHTEEMLPVGGFAWHDCEVVDNYILSHVLVSIWTFLTEKKILPSEKFDKW